MNFSSDTRDCIGQIKSTRCSSEMFQYCEIFCLYMNCKDANKQQRSYNNVFSKPQTSIRLLLLLIQHVCGATSGELPTFKEACIRLRLLEDNDKLYNSLIEAAKFRTPRQLLNMFAMMCRFNHPVNAVQLWNEQRHRMFEDLLIDNDKSCH